MLSKPENGWTTVTIRDFQITASDLSDIPFDWLRACLSGLQYNIPVSLFFDGEGVCGYISSYYGATYIIADAEEIGGEAELYAYRDIDLLDITYVLILDIKDHFEEWVKWRDFEYTEDDYQQRACELKQLIEQVEQALYDATQKHHKSLNMGGV